MMRVFGLFKLKRIFATEKNKKDQGWVPNVGLPIERSAMGFSSRIRSLMGQGIGAGFASLYSLLLNIGNSVYYIYQLCLLNALIVAQMVLSYHTVRTRIPVIEPHPRALELPLPMGPDTLSFCLKLELRWLVFAVLSPLSKRGNFGRLSTSLNRSSSYSMQIESLNPIKPFQ